MVIIDQASVSALCNFEVIGAVRRVAA